MASCDENNCVLGGDGGLCAETCFCGYLLSVLSVQCLYSGQPCNPSSGSPRELRKGRDFRSRSSSHL